MNVLLAKQEEILRNQVYLGRNQHVLAKKIDAITALISDLFPNRPGPITFTVTGESAMDRIQFQVNLPPKSAPDVVNRELTVVLGDGEPDVKTLPGDALVVEDLEGDQDSTVQLSLVDIDDAGNRSEASKVDGILTDTVAPPQPGALAIQIIGEAHTEPDPVDPPV